jgi:hypothetical protein
MKPGSQDEPSSQSDEVRGLRQIDHIEFDVSNARPAAYVYRSAVRMPID